MTFGLLSKQDYEKKKELVFSTHDKKLDGNKQKVKQIVIGETKVMCDIIAQMTLYIRPQMTSSMASAEPVVPAGYLSVFH